MRLLRFHILWIHRWFVADYYQDTIFEIMVDDQAIGAKSTICGGGRYDGLVRGSWWTCAHLVWIRVGVERLATP